MYFRKNYDIRNIKTKLISILYGAVCHITFVISGMCMFWVLYNGFTVSLGSVRQPLSIVINIFLLLQFPILHSFLLKYTLHTHPVAVNMILIRKNCKEIIESIFSNDRIAFVKYETPGVDLAIELKKVLRDLKEIPHIIFFL